MTGIVVRPAREADASALLALQQALDGESRLMMLEPDERPASVAAARAHIIELLAKRTSALFVADAGAELAGYIEAEGGAFRRNRHRATLVLGVRAAYGRRGLGRRLLEAVTAWAPYTGVTRLELTVMAHNTAAIALYRAIGFEQEGLRRRSLIVDGAPVDELAMALLL